MCLLDDCDTWSVTVKVGRREEWSKTWRWEDYTAAQGMQEDEGRESGIMVVFKICTSCEVGVWVLYCMNVWGFFNNVGVCMVGIVIVWVFW